MPTLRVVLRFLPIALVLSVPPTMLAQSTPLPTELAELPSAPLPDTAQSATPEPPAPTPAQPQTQSSPAPTQSSTSQTGPAPSQTGPPTEQQNQPTEDQVRKLEKQRILGGVVPDFNTVNGQNAPPLTPGQKFHLAFRSSVDPFVFGTAAFLALVGQANDTHAGYGQGMQGYAKRFGANYADSFSGTFFGNALFPVLFHEDPRYFRLGEGPIKHRLWYAALTAVRTRTDSGKRTWNYANVLGNIAAGGLSNVYYPQEDRGVGLTFENAAVVTAEGSIGAMAIEFYPDLARKFLHHKQPPGTSATNTQATPPAVPPPSPSPQP